MKPLNKIPISAVIMKIQKLLKEEIQILADLKILRSLQDGTQNVYDYKRRHKLWGRLSEVRKELSRYSDLEIELAIKWDKLKDKLSNCPGLIPDDSDTDKAEQDNRFFLALILYFLAQGDEDIQHLLLLIFPEWGFLFYDAYPEFMSGKLRID